MKNLKRCFVVVLLSMSFIKVSGQSNILFNYDWHLTEIRVGSETYFPPDNLDIQLNLPDFPYDMTMTGCGSANSTIQYYGTDTNAFRVENYSYTSGDCESTDVTAFEQLYFETFWINHPFYFFLFYPGEQMVLEVFRSPNYRMFYYGTILANPKYSKSKAILYPNPTAESLKIFIPENFSVASCKIYTATGTIVGNHKIVGNETILDLSFLPSGIYQISIDLNNQILNRKIIKL